MKKIISLLIIIVCLNISFSTSLEASVVRGKKYYVKILKKPCGFKGDIMGKYHTKREWRNTYRNGTLGVEIKKICPNAPDIESKKKLKHLYHFLSSFASDSGNVPSCN